MKTSTTITLIVCLAIIASTHTYAQKMRAGLTMGYELDMIQGLSPTFFNSTTNMDLSDARFNGDITSMNCENAHYRAFLTTPSSRYNGVSFTSAAYIVFNRFDQVSITHEDTYLDIGSLSNEIAGEFSIEKRAELEKVFYLEAGIGNNVGLSYGGYSYVNAYQTAQQAVTGLDARSYRNVITATDVTSIPNNHEIIRGKNNSSINARLFGKLGGGIILFDTIEIGMIYRLGGGLRLYSDQETAYTRYFSMELNAGMRF